VKLQIDVDGKAKTVTLMSVLHVLKLGCHLVSVSAMESNGMSTNFANGQCNLKDSVGHICVQATRKGACTCWTQCPQVFRVAQRVRQM
jgi:hypothetical protein